MYLWYTTFKTLGHVESIKECLLAHDLNIYLLTTSKAPLFPTLFPFNLSAAPSEASICIPSVDIQHKPDDIPDQLAFIGWTTTSDFCS